MQDHEVREWLKASLQDGQFAREERDGLRAWLESSGPGGQKRAVYQSMAFDLAREAIESAKLNHHSALNWLEKIVKLVTPLAPTAASAVTADVCFSPQHDCAGRIVGLFDSARTSVEACVFTITDDRITSAIERAHRRGVRVRVVTDNDKLFDPGSDIERLKRAGVPVRIDISEFHMHHKFAIFDGVTLLNGSYNWTRSAALYNEENFVVTNDPRLIPPFRELFEALWTKFSGT
jgi:mitochondrial cardiolipin hydrolase